MIRLAALFSLVATPLLADIRVDFDEGAPVDRFTILNDGACPLGTATVTVDLDGSAGGLIFDTTAAGAGIEVFQPFRIVAGAERLTGEPLVSDGDTAVALPLRGLPPGARVAFTIDVDDTVSARGIMVAGGEIDGARVRVATEEGTAEGRFGTDARARVAMAGCVS